MRVRFAFIFASFLALGTMGACGGKTAPTAQNPSGERPLFDRLGAKASITQIVDDFIATVQADERVAHYFNADDVPKLKSQLVDEICFYADGPCKYEGKNLRATHADMGISGDDFDVLVEDLKAALVKNRVGEHEQSQLLDKLGVNEPDVGSGSGSNATEPLNPESAGSSS